MVTIIFGEKKNSLDSSLAIELAKKLREVLGDKLIALNTTSGFDGSNVRIIVKNKTFEDNRKIMQVIGEIEEKFDIHGKILPEILGEESFKLIIKETPTFKLPIKVITEIRRDLSDLLGARLVDVSSIDGFDGSNVRIIVKNKTFEDNRKIMQVIGEIEEKFDIHGKILPEILGEESVEYLSEESK